jgi:Ca2+/Na+ antiporter
MKELKGIKFNEGEKAQRVVRHHHIIVAPHLVISFLILVLDFFMMFYLFLQGTWGIILFFAVMVVVAFYVFRLFFLYNKNKFVITDERIIDVEQSSFFEKFINEVKYDDISEVIVKRSLIGKIFKFGNLIIKQKNDIAPYEMYKIPNVENVKKLIEDNLDPVAVASDEKGPDAIELIESEIEMLSYNQKVRLYKKFKSGLMEEKAKRMEAKQQNNI